MAWQGINERIINCKIESYDMLNDQVLDSKPKGDNHLPVHFFGSRDFAWFTKDSLKPLQKHWKDYAKKNNTILFKSALREAEDPDCLDSPPVTVKKSASKRKTMDDADKNEVPPAKRANKRRSAPEGDEVVCMLELIYS